MKHGRTLKLSTYITLYTISKHFEFNQRQNKFTLNFFFLVILINECQFLDIIPNLCSREIEKRIMIFRVCRWWHIALDITIVNINVQFWNFFWILWCPMSGNFQNIILGFNWIYFKNFCKNQFLGKFHDRVLLKQNFYNVLLCTM